MGVVTRAKKRRLENDEEYLEGHTSHVPDAVLGDIARRSDSPIPNPHRRPPPVPAATGALTRAKKRGLEEEDEAERLEDRISSLPDAVLGEIVSLLPSKDGARTQVLSSRWRHIWRSAPLNVDVQVYDEPFEWHDPLSEIPRILSSHPGPGRRLAVHLCDDPALDLDDSRAAALDGWLRSPALHNLQQLEFHHGGRRPPLPVASVRRFSSTLRVASFGGFRFPDDGRGRNASSLHLPLLQQLTLVRVRVSEKSLRALLAGCPVLESFLLLNSNGFRRLLIVSPSLRSIGVSSCWPGRRLHLQLLVIKDAPCLERLLFLQEEMMDISVISAPRLQIFGKLFSLCPMLHFGTTVTQGSFVGRITEAVRSVKVLALSDVKLFLDPIINLMKCFPHLETLYIKTTHFEKKNAWCRCRKYVCLRKIVLTNYLGNYSHVNFAKFFVSKARLLESMSLKLGTENGRQRMG